MEESIEHSPNQQRRRSGYRPMIRKRHSRVWNESSERRERRKVAASSVVQESPGSVVLNPNLIYFDVNTEQIEVTDADPLAPAAVLEKANQVPRESVVPPSQEFLQNVRNRFVKIEDVIEPEEVPGTPEHLELVQVKAEPVKPTTSKKANYSYTQFDLDTQMLDILEGADMLAGLGTCPEQQELKEWSSPAKPPKVEEKIPVEKKRVKQKQVRKRRRKTRNGRSLKRYHDVRQSSFSRDVSIALPDCSTPPIADLSTSIMLDFDSDSDAEFTVDYSRILSTPLRRHLIQLQNHIDSPPQQVNRESIRRTFSRRRSNVKQSPKTPIVVRRLSLESKTSDRNELSSDEELAATQIDPDRLVPLEPSPEKENFDASLLIKANINQLSQFFSQSVEVQERSKSTPESTPSREASSVLVAPLPLSPISLESTGGGSPRTMNIEWLFRSEAESSESSEHESASETGDDDYDDDDVEEQEEEQNEDEAVEVVVKTEPDEALHRMLDDDDEFLVQLPTTQKEVQPERIVVENEIETVEGSSSNRDHGKSQQFAQENATGIHLGDPDNPIHVILDDNCRVGLDEFTSAFLAAPGIDPALVPSGWIENAWKWILLKLSSMERKLPQHFCDITSPGNVMDQLLFRYHVEIDCAKRSVIRKMLEKDDVPGKRMVLFVSKVFRGQNPFEAEIELCDGWYPIRTVLDYPLTEAVLKGRIVVGTKLMIQGAELLNLNDGCAPLEVPVDVRLRIHANSTRRAHWLAKLGLYQIPTSFLVSCNHIADRGGLAVRLQLVVIRVYPTLYKEKTQNGAQGSVLRSERVERRRSMANDANRFDNFQKLFSQVQKELESERSEKVSRNGSRRMTVTRSTTTAELLELVEGGLDLSCIEYELTSTQRDAILDHQRRKQEEFAQEVNRRVKDLMTTGGGSQKVIEGHSSEARTVVPLLKFRLMDARKPEKTLLMSIWRPPDDIGEVVQERRVLEVMNVTANGSKNGEIQLSTGKNSNYRVLDRMQFVLPERFFRRVTKISEIDPFNFQPLYNEFDTVGVVVHVAALDTKKFQDVYLADVHMNLLCVNFWSGIKEYAYEDVVKERSVLCVANLQWRSFNLSSTIPNSFANELTTFSEHSKAEHFTEELGALKSTLNSIDIDQFFQDCSTKVLSLKDKKLPRSNSFNTPLRNSSSASTPARSLPVNLGNTHTPTNFSPGVTGQPVSLQKRKIELLTAAYRSPPKKSPIVLRRNPHVSRNFKTPLRLEEKIKQT